MGSFSKVGGAGIGGTLGIILVYLIGFFMGKDLPQEVAGAIVVLIGTVATYWFPANTPSPEAVKAAVTTDATVAVAAKEGLAAQAEAAKPTKLAEGNTSTMKPITSKKGK